MKLVIGYAGGNLTILQAKAGEEKYEPYKFPTQQFNKRHQRVPGATAWRHLHDRVS